MALHFQLPLYRSTLLAPGSQSTKLYRLFQRMGDFWESDDEEEEEDSTPVQGQTARRPAEGRAAIGPLAAGRQSGSKRSLAFCLATAGGGAEGPARRQTLSGANSACLETEKGKPTLSLKLATKLLQREHCTYTETDEVYCQVSTLALTVLSDRPASWWYPSQRPSADKSLTKPVYLEHSESESCEGAQSRPLQAPASDALGVGCPTLSHGWQGRKKRKRQPPLSDSPPYRGRHG